MIAQPDFSSSADLARRLAAAFRRMVRNRRAFRDLAPERLADCGISREAMERAVDWRFWRRLDEGPVTHQKQGAQPVPFNARDAAPATMAAAAASPR